MSIFDVAKKVATQTKDKINDSKAAARSAASASVGSAHLSFDERGLPIMGATGPSAQAGAAAQAAAVSKPVEAIPAVGQSSEAAAVELPASEQAALTESAAVELPIGEDAPIAEPAPVELENDA